MTIIQIKKEILKLAKKIKYTTVYSHGMVDLIEHKNLKPVFELLKLIVV